MRKAPDLEVMEAEINGIIAGRPIEDNTRQRIKNVVRGHLRFFLGNRFEVKVVSTPDQAKAGILGIAFHDHADNRLCGFADVVSNQALNA